MTSKISDNNFFNSWGGVRLSPLGIWAISGPTVPAPNDRALIWMTIGRGNRSTLCTTNPTRRDLWSIVGRHGVRPETNRLSYGTALRAAAHQLRQDRHQGMRQKWQKLTSASWLRPVCGGFHNLIRFKCAPFFAPCRRHRVLTVTCLDACRCAAYLRGLWERRQGRGEEKLNDSVSWKITHMKCT
jgi:hypothetical protein